MKKNLTYSWLRLISVPCRDLALCPELAFSQIHLDVSGRLQITAHWLERERGGLQHWNILHDGSIMFSTSSPKFADVLQRRTDRGASARLTRKYGGSREAEEEERKWTILNAGRCGALTQGCCRFLAKPPLTLEGFKFLKRVISTDAFQLVDIRGRWGTETNTEKRTGLSLTTELNYACVFSAVTCCSHFRVLWSSIKYRFKVFCVVSRC